MSTRFDPPAKRIIVEGADGHGKSRLAKELANYYNLTLYTCGPRPKTGADLHKWIDKQSQQLRAGHLVLDRATVISHGVYNRALGTPALAAYDQVLPPYEIVIIRCKTKDPMHMVEQYDDMAYVDRIEKCRNALEKEYDKTIPSFGFPHATYDWRKEGAFQQITDWIDHVYDRVSFRYSVLRPAEQF